MNALIASRGMSVALPLISATLKLITDQIDYILLEVTSQQVTSLTIIKCVDTLEL